MTGSTKVSLRPNTEHSGMEDRPIPEKRTSLWDIFTGGGVEEEVPQDLEKSFQEFKGKQSALSVSLKQETESLSEDTDVSEDGESEHSESEHPEPEKRGSLWNLFAGSPSEEPTKDVSTKNLNDSEHTEDTVDTLSASYKEDGEGETEETSKSPDQERNFLDHLFGGGGQPSEQKKDDNKDQDVNKKQAESPKVATAVAVAVNPENFEGTQESNEQPEQRRSFLDNLFAGGDNQQNEADPKEELNLKEGAIVVAQIEEETNAAIAKHVTVQKEDEKKDTDKENPEQRRSFLDTLFGGGDAGRNEKTEDHESYDEASASKTQFLSTAVIGNEIKELHQANEPTPAEEDTDKKEPAEERRSFLDNIFGGGSSSEAERNDSKDENESRIDGDNDDEEERYVSLKHQVKQLREENARLKEEKARLRSENRRSMSNMKQQNFTDFAQLQQTLGLQQHKTIDGLENELNMAKREMKVETTTLRQLLDEQKEKAKAVQADLSKAQERVKRLGKENQELVQKESIAQEKLLDLQKQMDSTKSVAHGSMKVQELESKIKELEAENSKLRELNRTQAKSIRALEKSKAGEFGEEAKTISELEDNLEKGAALLANIHFTKSNCPTLVEGASCIETSQWNAIMEAHNSIEENVDANGDACNEDMTQYDFLKLAISKKQDSWWGSLDDIFNYSDYVKSDDEYNQNRAIEAPKEDETDE